MWLSEQELARWQREGWVAPQLCVPPQQVVELSRFADELAAASREAGGVMLYSDDEARDAGRELLSRVEYFQRFHAGLRAFSQGEFVCGVLSELLGEAPRLFKDKINYKLPGGSSFAPHQDVQAGWDKYCATHVTLVVHLDRATVENGCLEVASGAARGQLLGESFRPLEGEALARLRFVPCPAPPGGLLAFDSYVPHRSAGNLSNEARRVLYLTYNPASQGDHYERYFSDKRAAYPPDAERAPGSVYRYRV